MDTIFATSSGRPPAAIAVIRISGPRAFAAGESLAGGLPEPRRASLRALREGDGVLDRALVLTFPGPATATGEDLVEFHCHGGRAVIAAVEAALGRIAGLRPAVAGEFTRRALGNGRIDLAEAEGLADLLEAETQTQRQAALSATEGRVSQAIRSWMDRVAMLSARVEAMLDFADEDDVDNDAAAFAAVRADAAALASDIAAVIDAPPVERLKDGLRVVIGGPPNSGKSTLLNLLGDRDAAIVSAISGTTRDRIDVPVTRRGIAYVLTDTAGLTATDDPIEAIGVARAEDAFRSADIPLWLGDETPPRADAIWVHARADIAGRERLPAGRAFAIAQDDGGSGERVWTALHDRAVRMLPRGDAIALKRDQRSRCATAVAALRDPTTDPLILGENLRQARMSLAAILGLDATGEMLDALFVRFCIGK
ncbi:tRNA uridine-5-carboxymethylaminomethyl(34) synthesis GTPase MnmE [Sphingomonas ginsenosidivorax]|uniref:tRNA modification GTPase MnmE n=1 Tax=Sphingomonas ginsenosidivorax TaxID=862135 RepID=A0A5C6UIF1_9SPHN|nr:tRNA uridine-5-carboxymethylaminomethyl(34) synthesis GTPase MnmE [Sphingomonas ginsenosidivorax]TXC72240.1 tRNA uridine-5-carboxymethylaminomethyl(34) synthesis GTPase MnmE [Sphingomonas ginsenosidivorax]